MATSWAGQCWGRGIESTWDEGAGELPRPGELVHVGPAPASESLLDGRTVPQGTGGPEDRGGTITQEREGDPAAPSFKKLGLSSDMCSHLEGRSPWSLRTRCSRGPSATALHNSSGLQAWLVLVSRFGEGLDVLYNQERRRVINLSGKMLGAHCAQAGLIGFWTKMEQRGKTGLRSE